MGVRTFIKAWKSLVRIDEGLLPLPCFWGPKTLCVSVCVFVLVVAAVVVVVVTGLRDCFSFFI